MKNTHTKESIYSFLTQRNPCQFRFFLYLCGMKRIFTTAIEGTATFKLYIIVSLLLMSLAGEARVTLPDSMLNIRKSYLYFITSPDTALAIIEKVKEKQLEPKWRTGMAEGDMYFNMRRYHLAVVLYQKVDSMPEISDSTMIQLLLLKRMMDCYDKLLEDNNLVKALLRLRDIAKRNGNKAFEAMANFTSGKWHHSNGIKELGYTYCLDAIETMQASDYLGKHVELREFYGEMVKMYARDGRYDDAMHMSRLQEAEALLPAPFVIMKAKERGARQVYAIRASMLAKAGRMTEADKAYETWKTTTAGNDIDDMEIFDYMRLSNHKEEALDIVKRYRNFLIARGDTISQRMLSVINKEALLHIDLGQYKEASEHGTMINAIIDSLSARRSREQMQTAYYLFKEQTISHKIARWLIILTCVLAAILLLTLITLLYIRYIRRRNLQLLKVLNSLDAYRRAVINGDSPTSPGVVAALEEMRALKLPKDLATEKDEAPDDEDQRLFVEMDKQVTRDKLFLKPGLGRDDLMRLIGVDKNRFGKMIGKYSDASNASVYINTKRVEYGAKLLLEKPEYTIATIATECGMSNIVTFNRTFKDHYNMTPSEYRDKMNGLLHSKDQKTT